MGSSRKPKPARAKSARPGQRALTRQSVRKTARRTRTTVPDIPPGVRDEIERQRDVLLTIITLLHCLHVVLELRSTHPGKEMDIEFDPRLQAAARCAYLPEMSALLLERAHAVFSALDSVNLEKASGVVEP
jgi:hypothetical protein